VSDDVDPNVDLIGLEFHSNYRGDLFDFTTTVTGTAEWNPAYVNVTVVGNGKTQESSRRAEHVRALIRRTA
jgi:hypothetical protein